MLGEGHVLTRNARNDLAQIYQVQKKFGDAEKMYNALLKDLSGRKSPMEHQVRSNLASCYFEMGNRRKAGIKQWELYQDTKKAAEEGQPNNRLITTAFNLAFTCKASKLHKAAISLVSEATRTAEALLGPKPPQTEKLRATQRSWVGESQKHGIDEFTPDDAIDMLPDYFRRREPIVRGRGQPRRPDPAWDSTAPSVSLPAAPSSNLIELKVQSSAINYDLPNPGWHIGS